MSFIVDVIRSVLNVNHGQLCFNWWKLRGKLPSKSLQLVNI